VLVHGQDVVCDDAIGPRHKRTQPSHQALHERVVLARALAARQCGEIADDRAILRVGLYDASQAYAAGRAASPGHDSDVRPGVAEGERVGRHHLLDAALDRGGRVMDERDPRPLAFHTLAAAGARATRPLPPTTPS